MSDIGRRVRVLPLERRDPPAFGDVDVTGRLAVTDAGILYAGVSAGRDVVLVVLTEGAESDPYARARFGEAVRLLGEQQPGRLVASDDDAEIAPWAAVAAETLENAVAVGHTLLAPVTLADTPQIGVVRGPDFRPHWFRRRDVGRWRLWPLPWPASLTSAGRWTYLASFAVVLLIATVALWLAIWAFRDQPTTPPAPGPNPPGPTTPSPTPSPSQPGTPTPTAPQPTPGPGPSQGTGIPPIV